jgi:hypothetical protein
MMISGIFIGRATVDPVEIPGPERVVEVTPQACLVAVDLAYRGFDLTWSTLDAENIADFDRAQAYIAELVRLGPQWDAAASDCQEMAP